MSLGECWEVDMKTSRIPKLNLFVSCYLCSPPPISSRQIAVKREEAVTRDMQKKLAEDKKMSKKEKDERTLWKKNEVADYEATTFSIFYNNALFLAIVIVASFYVLRSFAPTFNYVLSVGSGAGLLWLFSTGTK